MVFEIKELSGKGGIYIFKLNYKILTAVNGKRISNFFLNHSKS